MVYDQICFDTVPKIKIIWCRNKMETTGEIFAYVEMVFVDDIYFPSLGNNIESQWEEK